MSTRTQRESSVTARLCLLGVLLAAPPALAYDWLQFNGDAAHSGNNRLEKAIDLGNVATLALRYRVTLPAVADGAPVLLRSVVTASGLKDLLFVTTEAGHIVALDARTGATVWSKQYAAGSCRINNVGGACYTTSSPAIDPNLAYVYSYGLDGYVHKYQVGDGTEILSGGWPELATLKGYDEKESAAIAVATSQGVNYLYVAHGGYPGDNGDYQGHVTAINLATSTQTVFNTMCSNNAFHLPANTCGVTRSAIWARPAVIYEAGLDRVFMGTGNGVYDGTANWSESVIALNPNGTGAGGKPVDAYTAPNFQSLDNGDTDLGSTAPAILPVPANSNVQHLAVQGGKDAILRLLNLANLNGHGGPGFTGGEIGSLIGVPQGGEVLSQPAVWIDPADNSTWVFVANGNGISGLKLAVDAGGNPSLAWIWPPPPNPSFGPGATTSPVVANNILYYIGGGAVRALNPGTGATLWTSPGIGGTHWQSPIVANGVLYVIAGSALSAFAPPIVPVAQDFNGDGKTDLLLRDSASGQTMMWLMNGAAPAAGGLIMPDATWSITHVADFNGDNKADLIWRNSATGDTAMWVMNGATILSGGSIMPDANWSIAFLADFTGEGWSDIVWRNGATGETAMWLMNGTTLRSGGRIMADPNWSVTHVGDFNGDGKSDLVWRNSLTGETVIWLMDGTTPLSGRTIMTDPNWSVTHVADFDGDGKSDLLWRNSATGETAMWLMDGTTLRSGGRIMADPSWSVTHVGDFNGDGKSDLVWRNSLTGETTIWLMDGTTPLSGATIMTDPNWSVTHVADFDGDGKSDLVWRNSATNGTAIWLMNGTTLLSGAGLPVGPTWFVANPQ